LRGGDVRIWDAASGEAIASFPAGQSGAIRFSADGARLAFAGKSGVSLWQVAQRRLAWTWPAQQPASQPASAVDVSAVDFSADGTRLLVAGSGARAYVLDAADGRVTNQLPEGLASNLLSARYDPSGEQAVFGDSSGIALIWRPRDGHTLILRGHSTQVRSAEFSGDGAFVLTTSGDGTGRIWDAANGQMLEVLAVHGSPMPKPPFHAAAFSPSGDSVLTGSRDGVFRLWLMRLESRSPESIGAILRCRVPWQLAGDDLQPATPDDAACPAADPGR
jgi:WD40 repeat protein